MTQSLLFDESKREPTPSLGTLWSLWERTTEPIRFEFLDHIRRKSDGRSNPTGHSGSLSAGADAATEVRQSRADAAGKRAGTDDG